MTNEDNSMHQLYFEVQLTNNPEILKSTICSFSTLASEPMALCITKNKHIPYLRVTVNGIVS